MKLKAVFFQKIDVTVTERKLWYIQETAVSFQLEMVIVRYHIVGNIKMHWTNAVW